MIVVSVGAVSRNSAIFADRPDRQSAINILLGFGFIFISGFAAAAGDDRGRDYGGVLYQERSRLTRSAAASSGLACYSPLADPVRSATLSSTYCAAASRNHDGRGASSAGMILDDRGPHAGAWREPPRPLTPPPPLPSLFRRRRLVKKRH